MSELTIPERVAAGAAWLDENRPNWMDRIFLETLDVSSCTLCVLGQVFGDYADAPDEAKYNTDYDEHLDDDDEAYESWRAPARDRGFERYDFQPGEYEALTAEWRRLIESRRSGAVSE